MATDPATLAAESRCLAADLFDHQLLAAFVYLYATLNGMSADPQTLVTATKCLSRLSDHELLAIIAYGINSGTGGLTFTDGTGDPPADGSITTQGYRDTTNPNEPVLFLNTNWPDTANPEWSPI